MRVLSTAAYSGIRLNPGDAIALLGLLVQNHRATHQFWPDSVSLRDPALFQSRNIIGARQITDVYLLGLCQAHDGGDTVSGYEDLAAVNRWADVTETTQ